MPHDRLMDWVLILFLLSGPGVPPEPVPFEAGHMARQDVCELAGRGLALQMQEAVPGAVVGWRCLYRGVAS
jgi:hypothetical protein